MEEQDTSRVKDCLLELDEIEEKWLGSMPAIGRFLATFTDERTREATAMLILDHYRNAQPEERSAFTQEQTLWRMACAMMQAATDQILQQWQQLELILDRREPEAYGWPTNQCLISAIPVNQNGQNMVRHRCKKQNPCQGDLFM